MLRNQIVLAFCLTLQFLAAQNVVIQPSVLANGGSSMSNAGLVLHGTIGQSIISTTQLATVQAHQGFWPVVRSKPKIVTSHREVLLLVRALKVYPNPAHTSLQLDFDTTKDMDVVLSIRDLLGRTQKQYVQGKLKQGHQSEILDVSDLAIGHYFLHLISAEGMLTIPVQVWR